MDIATATLRLVPMTLKFAIRFIAKHHRHNRPPHGAMFAVGAETDAGLIGVAVVGRPVARLLQDGKTCEVVRCCTDGTPNACSILYGACRRAAKALGYHRIVTYTLASEPGSSLKASGWVVAGETKASTGWTNRQGRESIDLFGNERRPESHDKIRWECNLE